MYQLGLVFQATPGALVLNSSVDGGVAVAQMICCSASVKSPQKSAVASWGIQMRPLATLTLPNRAVAGNLSIRLCVVSSASGARAEMKTRPATRSSVPAAVMTAAPEEWLMRMAGLGT